MCQGQSLSSSSPDKFFNENSNFFPQARETLLTVAHYLALIFFLTNLLFPNLHVNILFYFGGLLEHANGSERRVSDLRIGPG